MSRGTARPRSALEVLEREEEQALEDLKRALASAAEDLPLREVRAAARRHPDLAVAASAAIGVLLAPFLASIARAALPAVLRRWHSGGALLAGLTRRSLP
jgi:hypothetical protein